MAKLSSQTQKWLKIFHIYAASVWVGCATALSVITFNIDAENGDELYGILSTLDFIDLYILVPGAMGILLSGIVYSVWTNWGWFKHKWIVVKWLICLFGIVFGTFWLGPWLSEMVRIAKEMGMAALTDDAYVRHQLNFMIFGTFQAVTIIFAMVISTIKPWKRSTQKRHS